ncbi:LysR family transcriptional regulator [Lentibacillus cibarius]|uniref:LysR family transcriptional regulator n=1 Tax=Lentibacillus cibarius TaxID=2583219 RepID=A0A5S3QIR9_9BACI|nr:LysR family transcriptional regulator [Lentibacillus cibarius]TMN21718.1 LysR family transcriptional regulator [Lentibacillus cibarius]
MDVVKLKYFITIVDKGSMSKAASALNMTQPPLSMAIKKFEEELGVNLFLRNGKRLRLSEAGKTIYERGTELLLSTKSIIKEAQEKEEGKTGYVTIGCSTVANLTIIPEVVKRMNDENIKITTRVLEGNTAFILEQLKTHNMDIGLVRNIFDKEDYHTTALLSEPLYVALPPQHPLKDRLYISLEELSNENFLIPYTSFGHGISDFILEGCQSFGFTPNIIYWGTENLPMLNIVNRGIGIAFVPALFNHIKGFSLPPLVRLKSPDIHAFLNLTTLKNSVKNSATEQFLSIAKRVINEYDKAIL